MSILTLWQPILVAAVLTFIAGSVIWMAMPWHKKDWSKTSNEEAVGNALRGLAPGQYNIPHCPDPSDFKKPEVVEKFTKGPIAFITVLPSGAPNMAPQMLMMFAYNLFIAVLCAYFVSRTAPVNADYMDIFRISSAIAFISYGVAFVQESVWFGRPWSSTVKTFLDAAIYAGVTGGVFGWLA